MYGLVNKGLEDVIRARHGDDGWARVCAAAGVDLDGFLAMDVYPDELTYGLVAAAGRELGEDAATLLEAFGDHWVRYTAQEGYGDLFGLAGADLASVLENLDQLHGRLAIGFPQFRMPTFTCERRPDGTLLLRYRSTRAGLAPMVIGMVRGLGTHFGITVDVTQTARREDVGHDDFVITEVRSP